VSTWSASPETGSPRLCVAVHTPQAFLSVAEAGPCSLAFDGWLYNRDALRAALSPHLASGAAATDADLVLCAYERYGSGMLERLQGVFSLCLQDARRETLLAARDPLGVYPLFYAQVAGTWLFSTSVASLLKHPGVSTTPNRTALAAYLLTQGRDTEETFFAGVRRLLPGHLLVVRGGVMRTRRYWDLLPEGATFEIETFEDGEDTLERFAAVMERAVARTLQLGRAGVFLSGGLDSGTVATVATDLCRTQGGPLPHALSVAFADPEANEEATQTALAQRLGLSQTLLGVDRSLGSRDLFTASLELNRNWPYPMMSGFLPVYLTLGERAKAAGCDTILTGDGGDEWLGVHYDLAADHLRTLNLASLLELWRSVRMTSGASRSRVARHLLWQHGLKLLLSEAGAPPLRRLAPGALRGRRQRRRWRDYPAWLVPDPELRRALEGRFEQADEAASETASFYRREVCDTLEHPLTVYYMEEAFEMAGRIGLPILKPFYDPEVVVFLVRTPPQLRSYGGRYKGLLRGLLHARHPGLGYDRQKKPYATDFFGTRVLEGARQAWPQLRRKSALAELGVVEEKGLDAYVAGVLARGQLSEVKRLWHTLSAETWTQSRLA
jgi:asparagine synthase (glutamine-hydrolysing)